MNKKRLGCTLVTDKNQNLVGIITDGDLRRHINDQIHLKTASSIMAENPIHISSEIFAKEVLNLMKAKNITNLTIVDGNVITGIIHIHDLLRAGVIGNSVGFAYKEQGAKPITNRRATSDDVGESN